MMNTLRYYIDYINKNGNREQNDRQVIQFYEHAEELINLMSQ